MGKHKTASAGAPKGDAARWYRIDWPLARREVSRLQRRIAKAVKESRWNTVRTLQYLLTRSFYAKLLAVKRVTSNHGRNPPGVDGVLWSGARATWRAAKSLRRRGSKPKPLRRMYIPKKNGTHRPLAIPTLYDRAMQALSKLALAPVAETTAARNSYGFREGRGCADAIAAACNALSKPNSATWILEADITGCYDNISHKWMLAHIPMDREVLRTWLQAGYMEDGRVYPTRKGAPQGGIMSPGLANWTRDGLERAVREAVPRRSRVNFVRYADDVIVTGTSKRLLEKHVRPVIDAFLAERGLELSEEKTAITYIKHGCTFLGHTFRKHGHVLHITPSKEGVLALKGKVGTLIRHHVSAPMPALVTKLNETLRGLGNDHRHGVASEAFSRIDRYVDEPLGRMLHRRYPKKSKTWLARKYWSTSGHKGIFAATGETKKGKRLYPVMRLSSLGIQRYIKVKADANPYVPEYGRYFWRRRHDKAARLLPALSAREYRAMSRESRCNSRGIPQGCPLRMLERLDGKLSRAVLRGKGVARPLTYPGPLQVEMPYAR
jgi:RNA-directed DNA polymerase